MDLEVLRHVVWVFVAMLVVFALRCLRDVVQRREVEVAEDAPESIRRIMQLAPVVGLVWSLVILIMIFWTWPS